MHEHFQRLFRYDEWGNRESLTAIRKASAQPMRALERMAHVLSTEHVWLARLRQQPQPFPVWPALNLTQCESMAAELPSFWRDFLRKTQDDGMARIVTYKNTVGESWSNSVQDILTHVIMHSAYHRGQVALLMRSSGFIPANTDFIHGVRQGLLE